MEIDWEIEMVISIIVRFGIFNEVRSMARYCAHLQVRLKRGGYENGASAPFMRRVGQAIADSWIICEYSFVYPQFSH